MTVKLQHIYNTIECKFWDMIIPLLESDSEVIEWVVNLGYRFSETLPEKSFLIQALFWIWIGTSIGLAIGILIV